jgi:hypothetical protein
MNRRNLFVILILAVSSLCFMKNSYADVREFVVIDKLTPAPLRETPDGTRSIGKIPAGTKIEIKSKKDIRSGMLIVTWYEVSYEGKAGWISQYVTMGDVITEDDSGKKSSARAEGADAVRHGSFDEQAKRNFKSWASKNGATTYFEYPEGSDWQIWVRLTPDKYTTEKNVESIAIEIARHYKIQTGFRKLVIVTVWHPLKAEVYAKGRL